jgi:hypothetical protein
VRRDLEVLGARLLDDARGVREELGLELEVPDALVPATGLAVGRQVDEPVARDALLPERAGQAPQLGRVVEVAARLEEPERPPWGHRRPAEELAHLTHHRAEIAADEEVVAEASRLRRVGDAHAVVRPADGEPRVARVVEEHRVAAVREEERHRHVRARAVADVRVPELPGGPEPVERTAALAEAVEVLLAGEGEARVDPRPPARALLPLHPAVRRLTEEPVSRGVEEGQRDRRRRHLDAEVGRAQARRLAVVNLDRDGGPIARDDEGRPRVRRAPEKLDADDARRAEGQRDAERVLAELHGRAVPLESCRRPGRGIHVPPPGLTGCGAQVTWAVGFARPRSGSDRSVPERDRSHPSRPRPGRARRVSDVEANGHTMCDTASECRVG